MCNIVAFHMNYLPDCIRGFDENQGYFIWPTFVSLNVAYISMVPSNDAHTAFCAFRISSEQEKSWKICKSFRYWHLMVMNAYPGTANR